MLKQLRKKTEGFTIIEVMIVLAIAGLIILIVFLAVPALQRNSRNTAIKNDGASVLAAVNEFVTSNNGAPPSGVAGSTITGGAGTTAVSFKVRAGTTVTWAVGVPGATGVINVNFNQGCNAAGTDMAAKNRAAAVTFNLETGGANAPNCVEG